MGNWQMTVFLLLALVVMAFVMKLVALLLPAKREIERRAMSWVLFSPNSVLRAQRATGAGPVVLRILMLFAAVLLSYWVYWQLVRGFQIRGILLSYLAVPLLLLIGHRPAKKFPTATRLRQFPSVHRVRHSPQPRCG
jgi:hypothetical protein